MTTTTMRPPLTVTGAAEYLNIRPRHIRRLVAERRVRFLKVGRLLRFDPDDLDKFLQQSAVEPKPGAIR